MSDVIDRPILAEETAAQSRLRIIDCDVHPSIHAHSDLDPFLPKRWQQHLRTYGSHLRTPYIGTTPYPRSSPLIARRDAWPPTGGPPGQRSQCSRRSRLGGTLGAQFVDRGRYRTIHEAKIGNEIGPRHEVVHEARGEHLPGVAIV